MCMCALGGGEVYVIAYVNRRRTDEKRGDIYIYIYTYI